MFTSEYHFRRMTVATWRSTFKWRKPLVTLKQKQKMIFYVLASCQLYVNTKSRSLEEIAETENTQDSNTEEQHFSLFDFILENSGKSIFLSR